MSTGSRPGSTWSKPAPRGRDACRFRRELIAFSDRRTLWGLDLRNRLDRLGGRPTGVRQLSSARGAPPRLRRRRVSPAGPDTNSSPRRSRAARDLVPNRSRRSIGLLVRGPSRNQQVPTGTIEPGSRPTSLRERQAGDSPQRAATTQSPPGRAAATGLNLLVAANVRLPTVSTAALGGESAWDRARIAS